LSEQDVSDAGWGGGCANWVGRLARSLREARPAHVEQLGLLEQDSRMAG
jgi:hypothetical protein